MAPANADLSIPSHQGCRAARNQAGGQDHPGDDEQHQAEAGGSFPRQPVGSIRPPRTGIMNGIRMVLHAGLLSNLRCLWRPPLCSTMSASCIRRACARWTMSPFRFRRANGRHRRTERRRQVDAAPARERTAAPDDRRRSASRTAHEPVGSDPVAAAHRLRPAGGRAVPAHDARTEHRPAAADRRMGRPSASRARRRAAGSRGLAARRVSRRLPASCPAASASASASRARSCWIRRSCSWTNRSARSIPSRAISFIASSGASRAACAGPCSS